MKPNTGQHLLLAPIRDETGWRGQIYVGDAYPENLLQTRIWTGSTTVPEK